MLVLVFYILSWLGFCSVGAVHTVIRASVTLGVIGHWGGGGVEGGGKAIICAGVNATIKSCYDHSTFCSWE